MKTPSAAVLVLAALAVLPPVATPLLAAPGQGQSAGGSVGALDTMSVDIGQWYNDCFPANENPTLPGTAAFDTCAAYLQTGINLAPTTGTTARFDVPGDTVVVNAPVSEPTRVDMVFRIYPGPGNHVTAGNAGSGIRRVPTSPVAATPGDGSFWGENLANDGEFGSPGGHPGGRWSVDVWNSARCDTAEIDYFPVAARGNLPGITSGVWASMYHEDDPRFATLGIVKHRCFLVDTAGAVNSTNTTCSSVPAWATTVPQDRTGYEGVPTTREYTKIIPDGLLTPGSHVQYFFRKSTLAAPNSFAMVPDTNYIYPQNGEGPNYDGHRWQEFSVLPDQWKDVTYGGLGQACALVVDLNDRRGNERTWAGIADTLGATSSAKYGAHNGWHAGNDFDYTGVAVGGDPGIAVWEHGGCPGTTWDLYQVKASESLTTKAGSLGSRLANRASPGLYQPGGPGTPDKFSRQGPTPAMLRACYKILFLLTGDLSSGILGPYADVSQNDVALLEDFMAYGANSLAPRGVWVMGDGFVQSETQATVADPAHGELLSNYFALSLRDSSYRSLSGNTSDVADLIPTSVVSPNGDVFGVGNGISSSNDVFNVNAAVPGATPGSYYQSAGYPANAPYVASVYAPSSLRHPFVTLVDGWDIEQLTGRYGERGFSPIYYLGSVMSNVLGSICTLFSCGIPEGCLDVPRGGPSGRLADFLSLRNNPLASGFVTVDFGLAEADRVDVRVYDVTGRLVRTLVRDRAYPAGEHAVRWDGSDDEGRPLARGVYFTRVVHRTSGFNAAKKLTILR